MMTFNMRRLKLCIKSTSLLFAGAGFYLGGEQSAYNLLLELQKFAPFLTLCLAGLSR